MKMKIISVLFAFFFSIILLSSCENLTLYKMESLTNYITSFEDYYTYKILDSDENIYYPNEEQSNRLEEALIKFLSVDVVVNKNFKEENALKHFYACLVLSNNESDLFFMYNASPDGDASISIYDNKTFNYFTVNDYQAELELGVAICGIKDELKKDVVAETSLIDVFPWLDMYVFNEVEAVSTNSGTHPLTPALHEYYKKDGNKDIYLDYFRSCTMKLVQENINVPGGTSTKVIFKLNHTNYELEFYNGYLLYNGNNYSIAGADVYIDPDETDLSFNFDSISGELYKAGIKIDNTYLETKEIRFVPKVTENDLGIPEYELRCTYGSIYIYNNKYININDIDYTITKAGYKIDSMIDKSLKDTLTYIENPHVLSNEVMFKLHFEKVGEGPDYNRKIISLNTLSHYDGVNLANVLGLDSDISDEMIKSKYSILVLRRSDPIHEDFEKVTLRELFIEAGNLYVTVNYNAEMNGVYDASVCEYIEYVLVNNDFSNKLTNRFNLYCNSKFNDGHFNILPYSMIDDIKRAYRIDGPVIDMAYDIYINRAFGQYNNSVAVIMSDSLTFDLPCETLETVGEYTFVYPTTNTIKIYHEDYLFSLSEAFENGFITQDNLQVIYNLYNQ